MWKLTLRGGAFDRFEGDSHDEPPAVLIAWADGDECRMTDDPLHPGIVLKTAESYRRTARCESKRRAIYQVGDGAPRPVVVERVVEPVAARCQDGPPEWAR